MFLVLSLALVGWMLLQGYAHGPRVALWHGWLATLLLLPTWIVVQPGALTVDLRTVAALFGLAGLWLFRPYGVNRPWLVADLLVAALIVVMVVSERLSGMSGTLTALEVARKWLLPYAVGRCFLSSAGDVRRVMPLFALAVVLLAGYALVEAALRVNPLNTLLGKAYGILEEGEGHRWGLKRAQAIFDHPLYFGYVLILLLPWTLEARRLSKQGHGPSWWKSLPYLVAGALVCTASRGPLLAAAIALITGAVVKRPRWHFRALSLAAIVALALFCFREAFIDGLARWAGETSAEPIELSIRGQQVSYSGTNHRLLLFQVYDGHLAKVGLFGNGSELSGIDLDEVPSRFRSIDNFYLLFLLQHGYLALGLFLLLTAASLVKLGRMAGDAQSPMADFAAEQFGALVAVMLMLFSVWFAPDFGSAWLFCAGIAVSLKSPRIAAARSEPRSTRARVLEPKPVPAHAPIRKLAKPIGV